MGGWKVKQGQERPGALACQKGGEPLEASPSHTRTMRCTGLYGPGIAPVGRSERRSTRSSAAVKPVKEKRTYAATVQHASAFGSWRPFRPSGASLESEDGAIHLW